VTKTEKFCVLVLDDDICLTTIVTKALRTGVPGAEVLVARSVAEAQLLLSEFKIHFFILDINLPDGTGIDFLADVRTLFPEARVMMITGTLVPEYQRKSQELGVLSFRRKPLDTKEVVQIVRSYYETMGHGTSVQQADGSFAVSLTCLSALDIIQLKCLANATLVLQVASPQGIGRIYFENGAIIHAETPDSRGEGAFEEILRWKGGRIKEMAAAYKPPRTINTGWQGLLLNVAQKLDEAAAGSPTAGAHP
jgi:ActR/RegA family two-component response regulator